MKKEYIDLLKKFKALGGEDEYKKQYDARKISPDIEEIRLQIADLESVIPAKDIINYIREFVKKEHKA